MNKPRKNPFEPMEGSRIVSNHRFDEGAAYMSNLSNMNKMGGGHFNPINVVNLSKRGGGDDHSPMPNGGNNSALN